MKKIIIAVLCITVVVTAIFVTGKFDIGSGTTEPTEETTQPFEEEARDVYLPYYKGKAINPFNSNSPTNLAIASLLYDSLFVMNEDWSSTGLIASEYINDGKQVTVRLIDGAVFSNGASLTAYDVVYSFNLAKKSPAFKGRLSNFAGATAGADTVTFTLNKPDIFAQQSLTFPIVQNGTGNAALPIGSGRYVLRSINGKYVLSANPSSTRGESLFTSVIGLTPITSENDEIYRIQTGELSYYYNNMDTGAYTKLTAQTVAVPTNNLVYLGYNSSVSSLSDKAVITAIRYAIDKSTLADTVFDNFCTLTDIPFNPKWCAVQDIQLPSYEYNLIKAGNILDENGYNYSPTEKTFRYDSDGHFEVKIIVNKDSAIKLACAKLIAVNLKNLGLKVTLSALSFKDYRQALAEGNYDLYIGEVKISPNMDLSCFFNKGGSASYGISSNTISNAYNDFKSGSIDIKTFISVFEEEKPFIPLCYRTGIAYYSNEVTYEGGVNEYEPYKNIYSWETSKMIIN
ncbi:MAG: hypothetical protein IJ349_09090 [Clostridia bacterium]|nr:hypothetical protein [Clostridia bacterium]